MLNLYMEREPYPSEQPKAEVTLVGACHSEGSGDGL